LLHLVRDGGWPVEVAHLDHAGRPDSSLQAQRLGEICQQLQVPYHCRRIRVSAWARRYGLSWEAAGRELRYAWLKRLAQEREALLVTGHTADDQAETVLMRMLQGCTLVGLAGVYPQGLKLARPLLGWRRHQLRQHLERLGLTWFEDPSNQDPRFLRVRLRQQLMPLLEGLNSGAVAHLAQLAQDALELRPLLARPLPLAQMGRLEFEEFVHGLWLSLQPSLGSRWSRKHAQSLFAALKSDRWCSWNLPGQIWAEWNGHQLALGRPLALPDRAPGGLVWRYRRPGDRWGERSLKRIFHDWKVPRRARPGLPVLVRPPHQVVAVWGWRSQPDVADWVDMERSGLVIVEAAGRDEQATD
jgi:tRNA(Ile)-lysidine synthetase-like protein